MLNRFAMAYLDDITVYSKTLGEHVNHVKQVLETLANQSLRLKPSKCEFHKKEIEYLNYIVGKEKIKISLEKIQKILEWPTPITVKEVLSFMRLANFNRQFCYDPLAMKAVRYTLVCIRINVTPTLGS